MVEFKEYAGFNDNWTNTTVAMVATTNALQSMFLMFWNVSIFLIFIYIQPHYHQIQRIVIAGNYDAFAIRTDVCPVEPHKHKHFHVIN